VVEGAKMLAEALASGARIDAVYLDCERSTAADRDLADSCADAGARVLELRAGVLDRVCQTTTPQPVAAVVGMVDVALASLAERPPGLMVVCADVRDPGNAGTIVRTAGAAGAGAVVFSSGSVDLYNPKTVRSSAGVLFHLPVVAGANAEEVLDEAGRWGLWRWGTVAQAGRDYTEVDLTSPLALVFGNEAHGLGRDLQTRFDGLLSIPMGGSIESLNVATTAAVLCFEAARQRRTAGVVR
jgi:TrmH family RNA methyltransferase